MTSHRPTAMWSRAHPLAGPGRAGRERSAVSIGCVAVALHVVLSALLAAGCGLANEPQSYSRHHNHGDTSISDLYVLAVNLVKSVDDRSVAVVATFVNYESPDALIEVTVWPGGRGDAASVGTQYRAETNIRLDTNEVQRVGGPGHPQIHLPDPRRRLRSGLLGTVRFTFRRAGMAEVEVIVEEPEDYLAPYAPPPAPLW
jgi:hypothetical protein